MSPLCPCGNPSLVVAHNSLICPATVSTVSHSPLLVTTTKNRYFFYCYLCPFSLAISLAGANYASDIFPALPVSVSIVFFLWHVATSFFSPLETSSLNRWLWANANSLTALLSPPFRRVAGSKQTVVSWVNPLITLAKPRPTNQMLTQGNSYFSRHVSRSTRGHTVAYVPPQRPRSPNSKFSFSPLSLRFHFTVAYCLEPGFMSSHARFMFSAYQSNRPTRPSPAPPPVLIIRLTQSIFLRLRVLTRASRPPSDARWDAVAPKINHLGTRCAHVQDTHSYRS